MSKWALILLVVASFALFFVFAPVVPTHLVTCIPAISGSDYASLSNHFFGVGEVYLAGGSNSSYQFWTHGVVDCI